MARESTISHKAKYTYGEWPQVNGRLAINIGFGLQSSYKYLAARGGEIEARCVVQMARALKAKSAAKSNRPAEASI